MKDRPSFWQAVKHTWRTTSLPKKAVLGMLGMSVAFLAAYLVLQLSLTGSLFASVLGVPIAWFVYAIEDGRVLHERRKSEWRMHTPRTGNVTDDRLPTLARAREFVRTSYLRPKVHQRARVVTGVFLAIFLVVEVLTGADLPGYIGCLVTSAIIYVGVSKYYADKFARQVYDEQAQEWDRTHNPSASA